MAEPQPSAVLDLNTLTELELLGNGPAFVRDLIDGFLRDGEGLLAEMRSALDAGEHQRYRDAAHALKGSAGSVGAANVYEVRGRACKLPDHQMTLQGAHLLKEMRAAFDRARRALLAHIEPSGSLQDITHIRAKYRDFSGLPRAGVYVLTEVAQRGSGV